MLQRVIWPSRIQLLQGLIKVNTWLIGWMVKIQKGHIVVNQIGC
jgi:preprotein translocase subunit SecE